MKKLKFLVGAVALFAVVAVNVWNAATVMKSSALNLEDVEASAQLIEDDPYWYGCCFVVSDPTKWTLESKPCTGVTYTAEGPKKWKGTEGHCFQNGVAETCTPYACRPE